ncbi:hypothetical protein AB3S75_045672 [Citrus x aurantiifolia]
MALQIHSPSSFTTKPYHPLQSKPKPKSNLTLTLIKSQNTPINTEPIEESAAAPAKKPKPTSPGQGFGSSTSSSSSSTSGKPSVADGSKKKKQPKGRRERASVVRRNPVEKLSVMSKEDEAKAKEMMKNESAFLLAWLGVGGIILFQGIALAASGFLPEELDKLFVKYLYPTFTPTVGLFFAGTVAYGVLKYMQNEKVKEQK